MFNWNIKILSQTLAYWGIGDSLLWTNLVLVLLGVFSKVWLASLAFFLSNIHVVFHQLFLEMLWYYNCTIDLFYIQIFHKCYPFSFSCIITSSSHFSIFNIVVPETKNPLLWDRLVLCDRPSSSPKSIFCRFSTPMKDHPVTTEGAVFHHRDHCNDNCLCYRYRCWLCCYVVNLTWRNKCFPIDGKDTAGSQTCRLLSLNKSMSNSQYFKIVITWYSAFHWKSNEEKSIFSICNYMLSTLPCKFNVEKSILSLL